MFDHQKHTMQLKGKDYLPVAPRLAWSNDDRDSGRIIPLSTGGALLIDTELLYYGPVTVPSKRGDYQTMEAVCRSMVQLLDQNGETVKRATAHKRETASNFADFVEKAETGSIGRALAAIGYGTIQSLEFEEGEKESPIDGEMGPAVVDGPVAAPAKASSTSSSGSTSGSSSKSSSKSAAKSRPKSSGSGKAKTPPQNVGAAKRPSDGVGHEELLEWLKQNFSKPKVEPIVREAAIKATEEAGKEELIKLSELPEAYLRQVYDAAANLA